VNTYTEAYMRSMWWDIIYWWLCILCSYECGKRQAIACSS